ncbi:unnamed protein product [Orchesella dallaii]|uniref:Anaphase-promoting complex subunit 7 n=1 Tax=Orchesella dallaii TaxID=48710 RepID=A0ABP1QGJ9_9HEXA
MCSTLLNQSNPGMLTSPMAEYFKYSKTYYIDNINHLFKEQLYSSVVCLGEIALNLTEKLKDVLTEPQQVHVLILMGDSTFHLHEFTRAESFYRRALQMFKYLSKSQQAKDQLPDDCSIGLKYKLHLCLVHLKKPTEALNMLQSIPAKQRTARTNLALAKMYVQNGSERAAITSFKEVLREAPMSLDAIEGLISLGLREADLQVFFQNKVNKMPFYDWFFRWIKAHQYLYARDFPQALEMMTYLQEKNSLHNNFNLLITIGMCNTMQGNYHEAVSPLKAAGAIEGANMKGMDLLAFLYWSDKRTHELEKLIQRLTELDYRESRSEPWIALAYYAQLTNRGIRALYFAQKAVLCSGFRNLEALICKGNILLDLGNKQEACIVFREATQMCSFRYEPHKGLVDAYIAMQRFRDASTIATHASKKLGETPRVLTMCASPLSKDPLTWPKAKSYLEKALSIESTYLPAVFMLTEILEHEASYTAAIELLEGQIEHRVNPAQVHVRLAQLYIKKNDEDKAADHFQLALKLDPSNRDARDGLNRIDLVGSRPGVHHDNATGSFDAMDLALEDEEINDMDQADSELESAVWNGPHDAVLGRSN